MLSAGIFEPREWREKRRPKPALFLASSLDQVIERGYCRLFEDASALEYCLSVFCDPASRR